MIIAHLADIHLLNGHLCEWDSKVGMMNFASTCAVSKGRRQIAALALENAAVR